MAGDWIKVEKDTPEKQEVLAIAAALNLDPEIVFAKCFKLWRWADSNTVDGRIPKVTSVIVDALVHSTGFAQALIEVGWLQVREGSLVIPHFGRHMGQPAKKRAQHVRRCSKSRSKQGKKLDSKASGSTDADSTDALLMRSGAPESASTSSLLFSEEEKERKKKREKTEAALPANLDTPEFRAAWAEWQQFRNERRAPLPASTVRKQLTLLSREGSARAVEMIGRSILNGWVGLFPEKNGVATNGSSNGQHGGRGVGSGVRIGASQRSLDAGEAKTIRIGMFADAGNGLAEGAAAPDAHRANGCGH